MIQVEARDSTDATNRDDIRMHLGHIAKAFQIGDFDIPVFVHDTVPTGSSGNETIAETSAICSRKRLMADVL